MIKQLEELNKTAFKKFLMTGDEKYLEEIKKTRKAVVNNMSQKELMQDLGHEEKLCIYHSQKDYNNFAETAKEAYKSRITTLKRSNNRNIDVKIELFDTMMKYGLKVVNYCGKKSKLDGRKALVIGAHMGNTGKVVLRVFDFEECSLTGWLTTSCRIYEEDMQRYLNIQSEYNERMKYKFNKYYTTNSVTNKLEYQLDNVSKFVDFKRKSFDKRFRLVGEVLEVTEGKETFKGVCIGEFKETVEIYLEPEYVYAGDFRKFVKRDEVTIKPLGDFYATYFKHNLLTHKHYIIEKYVFKELNSGVIDESHLNNLKGKPVIFENTAGIFIAEEFTVEESNNGVKFPYVKLVGQEFKRSLRNARIFSDFEKAQKYISRTL